MDLTYNLIVHSTLLSLAMMYPAWASAAISDAP
jgi:hypothetical protein